MLGKAEKLPLLASMEKLLVVILTFGHEVGVASGVNRHCDGRQQAQKAQDIEYNELRYARD
jgi:hypothetical protein